MKGVNYISGNINRFYCVQWVLIMSIESALLIASVSIANSYECYITALAVIILTCIKVHVYLTFFAEKWRKFFGLDKRRKTFWYGAVIAASAVCCAWAYSAGLPMPNFLNNYLE